MPEPDTTYEANGTPDRAGRHTAYDVEKQLLGAAMIDPDACATIVDLCEPSLFADRQHQHAEIFEVISRLFGRDGEAPLPAVTQVADADPAYLTDLTASVATARSRRFSKIANGIELELRTTLASSAYWVVTQFRVPSGSSYPSAK